MFIEWGTLQRERDEETLADFKNGPNSCTKLQHKVQVRKRWEKVRFVSHITGLRPFKVTGEKEAWRDHICILESSEP